MVVPAEGQLTHSARIICDLHLKGEGDPLQDRFLAWIAQVPKGEALWILGDLFEYWIGDPSLVDPELKPVLDALQKRTQAGDFVGLIPGNRDFLIGAEFQSQTGVCVCSDGALLAGPGGPWLLMHGDEFCTLDHGYQRLRRVLRSKGFRFWVRHQPAFMSRAMARRLRRASERSVPGKDPSRMAMQLDEVQARATASGAQVVLCGHAHRFRDEALPSGGPGDEPVRFLVLDAFGYGSSDVLVFDRSRAPEVRSTEG
ncbi:MAG: UDP-2,3-diacylglucosamine hydrolase [Planctomycetota bacterium]|jgi:UDP-2,3-diacylglucosamine hydrolase